ncbi:hypothetical protein pEaSNUABM29_00155 [Erwinia phage pEa_SNUABM_29]|nr:hypothetical protein pEaSNUABM29_00155 [Erwinia phage pEa_SNUABM_29]
MQHFHRNNVSAIEGMHQDGFSLEEATRIRPFLPRRFYPFGSMFRTNIHAWEAVRAVEDAMQYSRFEFKFMHKWASGESLPHFHFQPNDFIEYVSPTYHTRFLAIEFVRHFGDALYTERSSNPDEGRLLVYVGDALRIKMRRLREAYERATGEAPTRDYALTPFNLPTKIDTPMKAINALRAGWSEWNNIYNPFGTGTWHRLFIQVDPYNKALFQTLCKQLDPTRLDLDTLVSNNGLSTGTVQLVHKWLPLIRLPDGQYLGDKNILMTSRDLTGPNPAEIYPSVEYWIREGSAQNYVLTIPQNVYDLFPREEWVKAFG